MPAAPNGWSGPILLYQGAFVRRPECTGEVGDLLFDGGTAPLQEKLQCYACGCGELSGGSCSLAYTTYLDAACNNQNSNGVLTTTCSAVVQAPYFKFGSLDVTGGCEPSGGTVVSRTEPQWEEIARGCGLSNPESAGCEDGSVCMPEPYSPFEDAICLYRAGDQTCPSDYPTKRSYTTRLVDERECKTCACVPSGGCGATVTVYEHEACTVDEPDYTSENIVPASGGACRMLDTSLSVLALRLTSAFAPGNCDPVQVADSAPGMIRAEGAVTVCCR